MPEFKASIRLLTTLEIMMFRKITTSAILASLFCFSSCGQCDKCSKGKENTSDALSTIPCFDLEKIHSGSKEEKDELIRQFGDGLRDIGFVAIKAPGLRPHKDKAIATMKKYFAQDEATKMEDWHHNNGQTGYSFNGNETAAGAPAADLKEHFFVLSELASWPKKIPEFENVMKEYHGELKSYAKTVTTALLEYLGESEALASKLSDEGTHMLRLAYYPSRKEGDDPSAVWAAAHQDLNAITLLPRPSRSGLQLKTKNGEWLSVLCPEDHILINCGDQISYKTAGHIVGTEHQVINDNPGDQSPRFSTIMFAGFPLEYSLSPFKESARRATKNLSPTEAEEYLSHYSDVTAGENLNARLIELGSFDASEDQIRKLQNKGLVRNPCQAVKDKFPQLF
jgi:isopenicillin N synthase-like dioxygenase